MPQSLEALAKDLRSWRPSKVSKAIAALGQSNDRRAVDLLPVLTEAWRPPPH